MKAIARWAGFGSRQSFLVLRRNSGPLCRVLVFRFHAVTMSRDSPSMSIQCLLLCRDNVATETSLSQLRWAQ